MGKNAKELKNETYDVEELDQEEDDGSEGLEGWDDWNSDEGEGSDSDFLCLFCNSKFISSDALFIHCNSVHHFDFHSIQKDLGLDFYGSFKLINYVRAQVAENRCWRCGFPCQSNENLLNHVHKVINFEDIKRLWDDDIYLKPFMQNDSLLYSFSHDEEGEDDCSTLVEKDNLIRDLTKVGGICCIDDEPLDAQFSSNFNTFEENGREYGASTSNNQLNVGNPLELAIENGLDSRQNFGLSERKVENGHQKVSFLNLAAKDIKNANESYFGAYSSFGIHREMLSDKVRMEAYRQAIVQNPSLMENAVVVDVGCGTGILSLFAAKAGASRVIAVEASEKMAAVATHIVKDNGLLRIKGQNEGIGQSNGVIEVVQSMVEELDKSIDIQPHSVDVVLSEWMGYCLLYESMLSSVLLARDRWLKPGGAILPDTATILVAGFGIGGTSIPFWENVYGFSMSYVGQELVKDAAQIPIVDIVDDHDIVTSTAILHTFDLATMKPDEVDFTASAELEPYLGSSESKMTWCCGVTLWFETGFTSRFCRESPAVLSTSPYAPKTHWSQTILTFREPIAIAARKSDIDVSALVGTEAYPAVKIHLRISIARAAQHRSIDISLETACFGPDGRRCNRPVQLFTLR